MARVRRFDSGRFIAAELMVLVGVICCFARVQSDTWWHLAAGRAMAETGRVMLTEQFSHTAYGADWANYEWLSEVVFYRVYQVGGMPLLVTLCALSLMGSCLLSWVLIRGKTEDRVLVAALALPLVAPVWTVRPQAFSLLLLMVVVHLVLSRRDWLLPPVFLLWANLHGGVALGLVILLGDWVAAAAFRERISRARVVFGGLALAATLLTPLGLAYWPEIVRSLQRSQVNQITEWRPPDVNVNHALFWIGAAAFVWLVAARWRRLELAADRTLAVGALLMLGLAVRSTRNIAPFALIAAPVASRLIWSRDVERRAASVETGRGGPVARLSVFVLSLLLAVLLIHHRWAGNTPPQDWIPVSREAMLAIARCQSPIYNHYNDGGFLIWFVPEQRVFLDSRQDPYPSELIQAQLRAERTGEYRELFARYAIGCAVLRPDSGAVTSLLRAGWKVTYRDLQWVVVEVRGS